jgi:hypothetical protein
LALLPSSGNLNGRKREKRGRRQDEREKSRRKIRQKETRGKKAKRNEQFKI